MVFKKKPIHDVAENMSKLKATFTILIDNNSWIRYGYIHDRLSNLAPKCFNKMRPLEFAKDQMNYDFHSLEIGTNFYSYDGLEFLTRIRNQFYSYDGLEFGTNFLQL